MASPPLPPAHSPLPSTFADQSAAHAWAKNVMADLYQSAVQRYRSGSLFDSKVAERSITQMAKSSLGLERTSLSEVEQKTHQLALLAINCRDERLSDAELLKEIQALPPSIRDKLLALPGVSENPRSLILFKDECDTPLLEELVRYPEALVGEFTPREFQSTDTLDLTRLEREIEALFAPTLADQLISVLFKGSYTEKIKEVLASLTPREARACLLQIASKRPEAVMRLIVGYFPDPKDRRALAYEAAEKNPLVLYNFPYFLQEMGIENEEELIALAKRIAGLPPLKQTHPAVLVLDDEEEEEPLRPRCEDFIGVDRLAITDRKALLEITSLIVENNPTMISDHFMEKVLRMGAFETSPADALTLAKILLRGTPPNRALLTLEYLFLPNDEERSNFCLTIASALKNDIQLFAEFPFPEERDRIAMAKCLAGTKPGRGTLAKYIPRFTITDRKERFEIAKIEARVNPKAVAEDIQNYDLTEEERVEIAEIIASTDFTILQYRITNFGLTRQDNRFHIAEVAARSRLPFDRAVYGDEFNGYAIWDHPQITEWATKMVCLFPQLRKQGVSLITQNYVRGLVPLFDDGWLEGWVATTKGKIAAATGEDRAHLTAAYHSRIELLAKIGNLLERKAILPPFSSAVRGTLTQIAEYGNREVAERLAAVFCCEVLADPVKKTWFESHKFSQFMQLPMIVPAALGAQEELAAFTAFLHAGRSPLRNANKTDKQMLLLSLVELYGVTTLYAADKIELIEGLSTSAAEGKDQRYLECLERFIIVQIFCKVASRPHLTDLPKEKLNEELNSRLLTCLKEQGALDLTGIDHFASKYQRTFANTRIPHALFTYAARLPRDPRLRKAISRFARSVLEGKATFKSERYATDSSSHLAEIAASYPAVWEAWQEGGASLPLEMFSSAEGEASSTAIDFVEFFRDKMGHNHDKGSFLQLRAYLAEPSNARLRECLAALAHPEPGRDPKAVQAEKLCLDLCANPSNLTLLQQIEKVMPPDLELLNDIRGQQTTLSQTLNPGGLQVVDTDDWQALLLAGSEVPGSCQRIDGDPNLNKCLLAYMLDGKNRMIAVVKPSGELVGRSIFRLLFQGSSPALFLEGAYSSSSTAKKAIVAYAKRRAAELGLPLFMTGEETKLESKGSSVPYEYVDAARGVTEGRFTISARRVS